METTKSESFYHKAIKQLIYKFVSHENFNIVQKTTEKKFKNRRADVFFILKDGKKAVVEVQHSRISIKEVVERTKEYNQQGIYILWILHGKGNSVADHKFPEHKKNVKISPVEKFLHKMYGGRVYYVNVNIYKHRKTVTPPFALHYSLSEKKPKKLFIKNFEYYYFRNSNFTTIPNWDLLCVDFNKFKIARFYEKNTKIILKNKILKFILDYSRANPQNYEKYRNAKNLIKKTIKQFKNQYGKPIIIECINLIKHEIQLNEKAIIKSNKSYSKKNL